MLAASQISLVSLLVVNHPVYYIITIQLMYYYFIIIILILVSRYCSNNIDLNVCSYTIRIFVLLANKDYYYFNAP
jgi:hypothetical protein